MLDRCPVLLHELGVPSEVVKMCHRDQVPEGGISVNVRIGILLEPANQARALRDFVWNRAIGALVLLQEYQACPQICSLSRIEVGAGSDGWFLEEPDGHGPGTGAIGPITGNVTP